MADPSYIAAYNAGVLAQRAEHALSLLAECRICPRACGSNRLKDEQGYCRTGRRAIVCSAFAHHGEEPPVCGNNGSGTIFFARCNLGCVYCQNYQFSQQDEGRSMDAAEIAACMLSLQEEGCHNINLVTPTHVMPQILESLILAVEKGLRIPLVYNTSGYELPKIIALLEDIVDIYLADMRYAETEPARKYSRAPDYPRVNRLAVKEMHRQVGPAAFDEKGSISKGLIIRHLVLPQGLSATKKILKFIAQEISPETCVSLLSQYFPTYQAERHPPLDRRLHLEEYEEAVHLLKEFGLENGWIQEAGGLQRFAGTHIKRNV